MQNVKKEKLSWTGNPKFGIDHEACKKTEGCTRNCPMKQKHRGACVVNGKSLKPDKMQTDEPKWLHGAGLNMRILRSKQQVEPPKKQDEPPKKKDGPPKKKAKTSTAKELASVKTELAAIKTELAAIKGETVVTSDDEQLPDDEESEECARCEKFRYYLHECACDDCSSYFVCKVCETLMKGCGNCAKARASVKAARTAARNNARKAEADKTNVFTNVFGTN